MFLFRLPEAFVLVLLYFLKPQLIQILFCINFPPVKKLLWVFSIFSFSQFSSKNFIGSSCYLIFASPWINISLAVFQLWKNVPANISSSFTVCFVVVINFVFISSNFSSRLLFCTATNKNQVSEPSLTRNLLVTFSIWICFWASLGFSDFFEPYSIIIKL